MNKILLTKHWKQLWTFLLLLACSFSSFAQSKVTGIVTSSGDHLPIIGATVKVEGTTTGVVTDVNGKFTINAKSGDILKITYIGFEPLELSVNDRTNYNAVLTPSSNSLNQVVVTGYSSQRKVDIIGSVSIVDVSTAKEVPTASTEELLQGQAPGVTVVSSGAPGAGSSVFIRGISSFGNTDPLYIIDGVQGSIHDLNPNDIESIQVLKDAGSAAIYGVRGSNGVIIVTTKKGKSGKTVFSYDAFYGVQEPLPGNPFHLLNTTGEAQLTQLANPSTVLYPGGKIPDYIYQGPGVKGVAFTGDPAVNPSNYLFDVNNPANDYLIAAVNKSGTDWFHAIFKQAPEQSHTFTASGGNGNNAFLYSLGYLNQEGTLIDTYDRRYSGRINNQYSNDRNNFRFGENVYMFYKENPGFGNQAETNAIGNSYRMQPLIPVYDIRGNYAGTWDGPAELGNASNPVAIQDRTKNNRDKSWNVTGNAYLEYDILKYLTARTSFGGTINNDHNYEFGYNTYEDSDTHGQPNSYQENSYYQSSWTWTNTLNFNQQFGKSKLKVLGGLELVQNYGRNLGGAATNYFTLDPNYVDLSTGTQNITNYSNAYHDAIYSLFTRVDYSFNDKYLIGATIRSDASSRFAPNKDTGYFPSVSIGWRISQENFMKALTWVDDLKLRGSFGVLGSQNNVTPTNAYTLFSSGFGSSFYGINGGQSAITQGFYSYALGNSNTTWEKDKITNVGLDGSILNNKINFSVEYYKKAISGLLFPAALPSTAGLASPPSVNVGDVQNTGMDISLGFRQNITNDLKLSLGLNVTTYKNTITNIPGNYFDTGSTRLGNVVREQDGHPIGSFFGYKVIGLFSSAADVSNSPTQDSAAPGRFKFADINGDGKIDANDRTFLGSPNPDFTYGINLGLTYKRFDFSMILYGSHGNKDFNYTKYFTDFYSTFTGAKSVNLLNNSWSPTNLNAKDPIAEQASNFSTSGSVNSFYIENGAFLKCRSLQLGYTFEPNMLKRYGVNKLKVYAQALNVFDITKYSGLDPELIGSSAAYGIDYGAYPNNQKSFIFGVNLTF